MQQNDLKRFQTSDVSRAPCRDARMRSCLPGNMLCQFAVAWLMVASSLPAMVSRAGEEDPKRRLVQITGEAPERNNKGTGQAEAAELPTLISRLDAEQFGVRNEATRQLLAHGPRCVPLLVTALGAESREIRFRVAEILRHGFTFDQVAPHLIGVLAKPYGPQARMILRDRALQQVSEAAQMENTKRLFAFWGTNIDALRRQVTFDLVAARGKEQVVAVVAPLIGLRDKARLFNAMLSRLHTLSLQSDHRHSPGYVIAEALAQGLLQDNQQKIEFAQDYIRSFDSLAVQLQADGRRGFSVRNEITARANMSDGATSFLVRMLDNKSKEHQRMIDRLGVAPEMLKNEFFRGLALVDARECYRCVGKVHIADMLLESLEEWPDAPKDGVVQSVVECAVTTISTGDKPKALALLDAIEGCSELEAVGLSVGEGLGRRLAKRLCLAALAAPNNRACHPVRAIHDRILKVLDAGVAADSDLFPSEFVDGYLGTGPAATSEQARLAIGRYVSMLEQLGHAGLELEKPGVHWFLARMSRSLSGNPELLKAGITEVSRLVGETRNVPEPERRDRIDQVLGEWAREMDG